MSQENNFESDPKSEPESGHDNPERTGGNDAVCFSAGLIGTIFGAGAIHAYLAADRKPPQAAAGVTFGALCAAAMQRCYKELEDKSAGTNPEVLEARRWRWFRKFLRVITTRPLSVFWRALPDRSDFFAGFSTLTDPATPNDVDFIKSGKDAAKRRDILATLSRWFVSLLISVKEVGELVTAYVRHQENGNFWTELALIGRMLSTLERLAILIFLEPFFRLSSKRMRQVPFFKRIQRGPLFGWRVYGVASVLVILTLLTAFALAIGILAYFEVPILWWGLSWLGFMIVAWLTIGPDLTWATGVTFGLGLVPLGVCAWELFGQGTLPIPSATVAFIFFMAFLVISLAIRFLGWKTPLDWFRWLGKDMLRNLQLEKGFIDDFHLRKALYDLFEGGRDKISGEPFTVGGGPFPIVVVASALQPLQEDPPGAPSVRSSDVKDRRAGVLDRQLFAKPETTILEALTVALHHVQVMGPINATDLKDRWLEEGMDVWGSLGEEGKESQLDLVAGTLIQRNPLPALFQFLRKDYENNPEDSIAKRLTNSDEKGKRAIHVLYEVPLDCKPKEEDSVISEGKSAISKNFNGPKKSSDRDRRRNDNGKDIIDLGFLGLRLAARRDSRMEVKQTNFINRRQALLTKPGDNPIRILGRYIIPTFADNIAPGTEFEVDNFLDPRKNELLRYAAQGCRKTLEELYHNEMKSGTFGKGEDIECSHLLRQVAVRRRKWIEGQPTPGLPEICSLCSRKLRVPKEKRESQGKAQTAPVTKEKSESQDETRPDIIQVDDFPNLNGDKPRIVFIASGGVFRGAFHVGLIASLRAMGIRPDLIAGASVGTLMGGAFATILTLDSKEKTPDKGNDLFGKLLDTFVEVDEKVALTRRFLNAAREISTRASTINLSPRQIHWILRSGSRKDPGFAATGAPPALIDAISTLFLLPHEATVRITRDFLAGHYGQAFFNFGEAVKNDTLRRLGIEHAIVDRSLLEQVAREILGESHPSLIDVSQRQPFVLDKDSPDNSIAFLATATNLKSEELSNFGSEAIFQGKPYSFVDAALASSAFPAVFAPVRECDIFPGHGRDDVLYSDGGMFDNLPFLPAIDTLVYCQSKYSEDQSKYSEDQSLDPLEFLLQRHKRPDLFLVGTLGVEAREEERLEYASKRPYPHGEGSFQEQVKIKSFQSLSTTIDGQCAALDELTEDEKEELLRDGGNHYTLDATVIGAALPIYPTDKDHLNGTFAFCSSLRLDPKRVCRSIADGCFQTLNNLARAAEASRLYDEDEDPARKAAAGPGKLLLGRAFKGLHEEGRIPWVERDIERNRPEKNVECPYFLKGSERGETKCFDCPFSKLKDEDSVHGRTIFEECEKDSAHKKIADPHSQSRGRR